MTDRVGMTNHVGMTNRVRVTNRVGMTNRVGVTNCVATCVSRGGTCLFKIGKKSVRDNNYMSLYNEGQNEN